MMTPAQAVQKRVKRARAARDARERKRRRAAFDPALTAITNSYTKLTTAELADEAARARSTLLATLPQTDTWTGEVVFDGIDVPLMVPSSGYTFTFNASNVAGKPLNGTIDPTNNTVVFDPKDFRWPSPANIEDARNTILESTGLTPNTLIMGQGVFEKYIANTSQWINFMETYPDAPDVQSIGADEAAVSGAVPGARLYSFEDDPG